MVPFANVTTTTAGVPVVTSWSDVILIVETGILFGIPVIISLYRIFL